jgi:RNA polymerase sigma-70 factor (ECF subfamily)
VDHLAAFLAAVPEAARAAFDPAATAALLTAHHLAARAAFPAIAIGAAELAAELGRRLGEGASPEALARCRADQVALMIAAARGEPAAVQEVEAELERELAFAGPRTGARPDQIEDARGVVREILFTDTPGRVAAVRGFAGRGDLAGYLRVIATRELIKIVQRGRREAPREEADLLALLSTGGDPELSILRAHYREGITACVRDALGKLDDRSRALLRYQLVDGWNVDRVGELYGVHRATAARWIAAARDRLGELIRREVEAQLRVAPAEVDSIIRLVQSRVELSLARLMASGVEEP